MNNDFKPSFWATAIVNFVKNIGFVVNESTNVAGKVLLNIFMVLAPAIAPAGPAILFGINFYASLVDHIPSQMLIWASVAAAIALECAAIVSSKTAIGWVSESKEGGERKKLWMAIGVMVAYYIAGIATTWGDEIPEEAKRLTSIVFTIAILVYIAVALWEDRVRTLSVIENEINKEDELEEKRLEFEYEEAQKDRQLKRQLAMTRQQQRGEIALVKAKATSPKPEVLNLVPHETNSVNEKEEGYKSWRDVPSEVRPIFATMNVKEIVAMNPSITERTALNWIRYSEEHNSKNQSTS